ncbi:hypothetical protein VPH35_106575 [Triticum aestivum]
MPPPPSPHSPLPPPLLPRTSGLPPPPSSSILPHSSSRQTISRHLGPMLAAGSGWRRSRVAGALRVLPLQPVRVRQGRHRPPLHRRLRLLHALRHHRRVARRQAVRGCPFLPWRSCVDFVGMPRWLMRVWVVVRRGSKRACITYCITYIISCIMKHSPQYMILMIGRVLGGIAISLLFSAFESWLVAEHNKGELTAVHETQAKMSVLAEAPGMQGDRAQSMLRLCCWGSFGRDLDKEKETRAKSSVLVLGLMIRTCCLNAKHAHCSAFYQYRRPQMGWIEQPRLRVWLTVRPAPNPAGALLYHAVSCVPCPSNPTIK